jgi:NgoPII restriction endonuclease
MSNIISAIQVVVKYRILDIKSFYKSRIRINSVGDALEAFIKDIFSDTVNETDEEKKNLAYEKTFSYFGNQNNPPDFILINGDAVEVKKIQSESSQIALNSSYPSAKIFSDSPMITAACRDCEDWHEKDIIYAIGSINKSNKLTALWLVYGDCYAASRKVYEKIRTTIANGVHTIPEVEFSQTKELGRVNKVDPLGITNLRIRGMWQIEHPSKVYNYLGIEYLPEKSFRLFALISKSKYSSFSKQDRESFEAIADSDFQIKDVRVRNPDNPAKLIGAKLISYQI